MTQKPWWRYNKVSRGEPMFIGKNKKYNLDGEKSQVVALWWDD